MLSWVKQFNIFCYLDNQHYHFPHHEVEFILAAGAYDYVEATAGHALDNLHLFDELEDDWYFGHLGYELKNEIESLTSSQPDRIGFPDLFFFRPDILIKPGDKEISIGTRSSEPGRVFEEIMSSNPAPGNISTSPVTISSRISKDAYINTIHKLRQHIRRGDCYEINFCQEFYAEGVELSPTDLYRAMVTASPNPFSAYYRVDDAYLACASPERYIRKERDTIISQPIKGTWPRRADDAALDKILISQLKESVKNRSENVMIVDLVRNDLSKVCREGTVVVEDLFGIQSFPHIHHMVSTVRGQLREGTSLANIVQASFPMGSMTGAPKKRVMELIDQYETSRRGIFSGAVGYRKPGGDFDFNVVIRSVMYNEREKYLSFQAGSGITFQSDPEVEYEECLLKALTIKKVLAGQTSTLSNL